MNMSITFLGLWPVLLSRTISSDPNIMPYILFLKGSTVRHISTSVFIIGTIDNQFSLCNSMPNKGTMNSPDKNRPWISFGHLSIELTSTFSFSSHSKRNFDTARTKLSYGVFPRYFKSSASEYWFWTYWMTFLMVSNESEYDMVN